MLMKLEPSYSTSTSYGLSQLDGTSSFCVMKVQLQSERQNCDLSEKFSDCLQLIGSLFFSAS